MTNIKILVTGAGGSAASNFIDALRKSQHKYTFIGSDKSPYFLELPSLAARYLVPGVTEPGYIQALNKIIAKEKIDFVHPQSDVEVAFLAKNTDQLNAKMFLPPSVMIEICQDKLQFNQILAAKAVPVPETCGLSDKRDLEQSLKRLLIKGDRVWIRAIRGAGSRASLPVNNLSQADGWIDYWRSFRQLDYSDFMVCEFLPGHEFAWQSLWHEGNLVTSQARERMEYFFGGVTASGQSSTPSVAKTTSRDDVNQVGEAAVRAVSNKPHGVFGVDMKEDKDGIVKVTEINAGRFFTTSNFFAHAGLNMPDLYLQLGLGRKPKIDLPRYNPLPDDLYWVRMLDMGYKLVKDGKWNSQKP